MNTLTTFVTSTEDEKLKQCRFRMHIPKPKCNKKHKIFQTIIHTRNGESTRTNRNPKPLTNSLQWIKNLNPKWKLTSYFMDSTSNVETPKCLPITQPTPKMHHNHKRMDVVCDTPKHK